MIKNNLTFFGLLALFAASCSNDEMNEIPAIQQDAIVVTAGLNNNTRVSFEQGDNVTHAYWDVTDQITLYAASQGGLDYQVSTIGEDGNTATFAPVGDALRNTDEAIYATYPATVIKEGLATLPTTDVWTDEKPLPFAYATSSVMDGSVNLSFNHLFAYLKLTLNAETTTDEVTSLWMKTSSSEPLAIKEGTYDIANDKLNLVESSNSIYFKLQEPFIATDATEKSLYIPILPQPVGETITLSILREHEAGCDTLLTINKETPSSGFLAGHAYTYSPKVPFIIDGNTITLSTAGMLSQAISEEEKYTITNLKIVGPLDGDDIRLIREMAGAGYNLDVTEGKLTDLDISEATIVEGGGAYNGNVYEPYYTENNTIGRSMFYNTKLKNMILPKSINQIGETAFGSCDYLTNIIIPESVVSIGKAAFTYCPSLLEITIPQGVTIINEETFKDCSSLTNIIIPDAVTSIGEDAFSHCDVLEDVTIGDGVTTIGSCAFRGCTSLINLTIGSALLTIEDRAFDDCYSLTSVILPDAVTSIGEYAFCNCSSLTSINIPDGVLSIGDGAFSGCSSLTSIYIPNGVTTIGRWTFGNCSLKAITLPDKILEIGDYAFYCCDFEYINIPEGVTSIGEGAFLYCPLRNITIPQNTSFIGSEAFILNQSENVICKATIPPILGTKVFFKSPYENIPIEILFVPIGCATAYSESDWAQYFTTIEEIEL